MTTAVPTDYRKAQSDLIYDLIEKSNPGFKDSYPLGSVVFSNVTDITVDQADPFKNDTSVLVSPKAGTSGMGKVVVKYRRIDLGTILRGMTVRLVDWYSATTMPATTWQTAFAARYGISITTNDWTTTATLATGATLQVAVKATTLCYKGTFPLSWVRPPQPLNTLLTDANRALAGRLYPGGNDFTTPGRKQVGEFFVYAQDGEGVKSTIEAMGATSSIVADTTNAGVVSIVNFLKEITGRNDLSTAVSTTPGGLGGLTWYKYSLPNASIPEANSGRFNRCLVIQSVAGSWFTGKIILHYKV